MNQFSQILKGNRLSIVMITLLVGVASVALTLIQPLEYRSSFSLLLIEKSGSMDGYAAAKSAERLSASLGKAVTTASFSDQVYGQMNQWNMGNDAVLFPADDDKRRDVWQRHIVTRVQPEVGMVKVEVFHEKRFMAEAVAKATSLTLVGKGSDYIGGSDVVLKVVDYPVTTKHPARPNIFINLAAGLLLGLIGSIAYQLFRFARVNESLKQMDIQPPQEIWQQMWGSSEKVGAESVASPSVDQRHNSEAPTPARRQPHQVGKNSNTHADPFQELFVRNQHGSMSRLPTIDNFNE